MHEFLPFFLLPSNSFLIHRFNYAEERTNTKFSLASAKEQKGKDRLIFTNKQNLSFPHSLSLNFDKNNHLPIVEEERFLFIERLYGDRIQKQTRHLLSH